MSFMNGCFDGLVIGASPLTLNSVNSGVIIVSEGGGVLLVFDFNAHFEDCCGAYVVFDIVAWMA